MTNLIARCVMRLLPIAESFRKRRCALEPHTRKGREGRCPFRPQPNQEKECLLGLLIPTSSAKPRGNSNHPCPRKKLPRRFGHSRLAVWLLTLTVRKTLQVNLATADFEESWRY